MSQTLLRINLPRGKELRGADFREMLARETNLPEEFFHYENGKPKTASPGDIKELDALPQICIVSGKEWVGILAQPGQEDLLDEAAGKAIRLVSNKMGLPCKTEMMTLNFGCKPSERPVTYWVREMVIKRRKPASRAASIEDLALRRIKAGLDRYADAYGLDLPVDSILEVKIVDCNQPRGLAIRTTKGTTKEFATLVNVEVTMFADLQGMWMLGNLTARGYGRVVKSREPNHRPLEVLK